MFSVKYENIKAAKRQHLNNMGMRCFDPCTDEEIARVEAFAKPYHSRLLASAAPSASVASLA